MWILAAVLQEVWRWVCLHPANLWRRTAWFCAARPTTSSTASWLGTAWPTCPSQSRRRPCSHAARWCCSGGRCPVASVPDRKAPTPHWSCSCLVPPVRTRACMHARWRTSRLRRGPACWDVSPYRVNNSLTHKHALCEDHHQIMQFPPNVEYFKTKTLKVNKS